MSGNEDQSAHKKLEKMASVLEETLSKLGDVEKRLEQVERGETAKTGKNNLILSLLLAFLEKMDYLHNKW